MFPHLEEELGPLNERLLKLVRIIEFIRIEDFIPYQGKSPGRPIQSRAAIARAFIAKTLYNFPTTRILIDRLKIDSSLRRICGWERKNQIPSESTFSRAFAEFAQSELLEAVHCFMVENTYVERIVGHVSRDSTKIEAREKPLKKEKKVKPKPKKRGRPKKGEVAPEKPLKRLEKQPDMTLEQMKKDLPSACDIGSKKNSQGYLETWTGYKLHIDAGDGGIPLSCILTSASVHDSQVALPLMELTGGRVKYCYELMDSAYDADIIRFKSTSSGHQPLIDSNPRRGEKREFEAHEKQRYKERTTVERINGRLKDEFGGKTVRVRGPKKVMAHLMFGIMCLTADQLMRFLT